MEKTARWYQKEAKDALAKAVIENPLIDPIAVVPTGAGKTFIISMVIDDIVSAKPLSNILILSHVSTILEQNHEELEDYFNIEIGLYSAGLDSKTIKKVTVAGIQSAHKNPKLFEKFDIVIIDEAHRVPMDAKSMYRKFLEMIGHPRCVGLTATPWRLGHGKIYEGRGRIFNECVYDLSSTENYNRLVSEGYLSEMLGKGTQTILDAYKEGIKTTAGDFNQKDLSIAFDRDSITKNAVKESVDFFRTTNRKLFIAFGIDIKHANNIAKQFEGHGLKVAVVHSEMEEEKASLIKDIKAMKYDGVVNVDVLTTGFDAPQIDLIVDLAPTKSPVKHCQKLGRGARIHPDKANCLVLDFAGNIETLGPINAIVPPKKKGEKGAGEPITKRCPDCNMVGIHPTAKHCPNCNFEFVFQEKIKGSASDASPLAAEVPKEKFWASVDRVAYSIVQKKGTPSTLRVSYFTGLRTFTERIALDHSGYPGYLAKNWVRARWPKDSEKPIPKNVPELKAGSHLLPTPKRILVDNTNKYHQILKYDY